MQQSKEPKELTFAGVEGSFTVNRLIFVPVARAGAAKAWSCTANGIRISERQREAGRLWEYTANRSHRDGSGTQRLERNGYVRTFVSPDAAARAALVEWT